MARRSNVPQNPPASAPGEAGPLPDDGPTFRYRVNWSLKGFHNRDHQAGDELRATEAQAAPYLGGVLTLLQDEDLTLPPDED